MPRRKRVLDDGDSDSSDNSDMDPEENMDPLAREERDLFENPYKHKRRRKGGKEDAIYGVFGEDSEEEGGGSRGQRNQRRSDWTKAPAFVNSDSKVNVKMDDSEEDEDEEMAVDEDKEDSSEGEDAETGDNEDDSDASEPTRPPSPRIREDDQEEESERPRFGGLGMKSAFSKGFQGTVTPSFTTADKEADGVVTQNEMLQPMNSRGGIGSRNLSASNSASPSPAPPDDMPSAFGQAARKSFVRNAAPTQAAKALSAKDMLHFNKIQGSFGAKMLEKMGWKAGEGLGTSGQGIATPIETKLRPQKMGIAFKGFKEKTEQSKAEARRRGEVVSDDEEDAKTKAFRKKVQQQEQKRSDVWKKPKKVKTKLEHKTYEQILAEAGHETPSTGLGQIIDATGAVPKEVSSLADVSLNSWAPSNDPTRIPEVRFNVKLIADDCKGNLDGLAREAKALEERRKFSSSEEIRLSKRVADEANLIEKLQKIQLVTNDIGAKSKELASVYEASLEPFSPLFYTLVTEFSNEFERYRLDEVVVAAIAPLLRRLVTNWDPLRDPTAFVTTFRTWRRALRVNTEEEKPANTDVSIFGSTAGHFQASAPQMPKMMTPFESLLWNVWLPRVRTSINNDWEPEDPQPAVKLYEAWSTFLPPFIRDNLLDQLILPKVQKAVANWNPKRHRSTLQAIVFPWLPHVGLRMEEFIGDARRKIKGLLRSWVIGDTVPDELPAWKNVFDASEWDSMLLKYVVPKLGAVLRTEFQVNPRNQNIEPLQRVLEWQKILRPSVISQILEAEFFPKWLDALHLWLSQPRVNTDEVARWYQTWKELFPQEVQSSPGVNRGFTYGLQLMHKALELGADAPTKLPRPDFRANQAAASHSISGGTKGAAAAKAPKPSALGKEITFKSIVEEYAASHNLLFVPTGKAHEISRMPIFRVSATADGKGGLQVYILDDAVWTATTEPRAISLEEMVLKANS